MAVDPSERDLPKREVGISGVWLSDGFKDVDESIRYKYFRLQGEAHDFFYRLPWKQKIMGFWCGIFEPPLVGVMLYKVVPVKPDIPNYHWVVVGAELPSAYIAVDDALNPACALDAYVAVMEDWIAAVRQNQLLDNVYPVKVPSDMSKSEYANKLEALLHKIDDDVLEPRKAELGDRRR